MGVALFQQSYIWKSACDLIWPTGHSFLTPGLEKVDLGLSECSQLEQNEAF